MSQKNPNTLANTLNLLKGSNQILFQLAVLLKIRSISLAALSLMII